MPGGASVRTLFETSVPAWSWNYSWTAPYGDGDGRQTRFVVSHDRSIDVIMNNQRGEGFVKQVFIASLSTGCQHPGSPALEVVDIGSNTGYYSMLAAAHGCTVLAVDAQPGCAQWFDWARSANDANYSRLGSQQYSKAAVRMIIRPISNGNTPVEMDAYSCWVRGRPMPEQATHYAHIAHDSHAHAHSNPRLRDRAGLLMAS